MTLKRGRKLRARIFIAIISILIFTECLIFGFYYLIEEYRANKEIFKLARTSTTLFKELVRARLRRSDRPDAAALKKIKAVFLKIQKDDPNMQLGWLEDKSGRVLVQGFPGPVPIRKLRFATMIDDTKVYVGKTENGYIVNKIVVPVQLDDGSRVFLKAYVRSLYRLQRQDILFLLVLLGVAVTIGPVALFVSRFVTRRLKIVSEFADRVLEGDLSARVEVQSDDEMSEIAGIINGMLDTMDRMVHGTRELAGNISHELRTPLTRVLLSRELMEDNLDNFRRDLFEKHLGYIEKDVERMNEMISRILLLSRLEVQPVMVAPEEINLKELAIEMGDSFESVLNSGKYHFEGIFSGDLDKELVITGPREDLATALTNLLENAIKYTPEGGRIHSDYHTTEDSVVITLSNSIEPGSLADGDQEALFEPFFRSGGSKKHGSGLGLAITAKVIRSIGGDISARVARDTFTVRVLFPQN